MDLKSKLFLSVLPVAENDGARNRKIMQVNIWLQDWCYQQNFGIFDNELVYMTEPGNKYSPHVSKGIKSLSSGLSRAN